MGSCGYRLSVNFTSLFSGTGGVDGPLAETSNFISDYLFVCYFCSIFSWDSGYAQTGSQPEISV